MVFWIVSCNLGISYFCHQDVIKGFQANEVARWESVFHVDFWWYFVRWFKIIIKNKFHSYIRTAVYLNFPGTGVTDPKLEKLAAYRCSKSGKTGKNASRDFHRYIHKGGKTFPVNISTVTVRIRKKVPAQGARGRRVRKEQDVDFPVIHCSSWLKGILEVRPEFWLAGNTFGEKACKLFDDFWDKYAAANDWHPIHERPFNDRARTIPIAIHGDEGRGLCRTPLLVVSFQCIVPFTGSNNLNMGTHHVSLDTFSMFFLVAFLFIKKNNNTKN